MARPKDDRPEILHPAALSDADAAAWRALQAATPAFGNPLLGPDFAQAVGAVREDARVAVWRETGEPVGFLAFHQRPGAFARPIGAPLSDYQALVSAPNFDLTATEAVTASGLGAFRVSGAVDPIGVFAALPSRAPAYRVVLSSTADDYLSALGAGSANRAKNLRRYRGRLERDLGAVEIVAPDDDPKAFAQLLAWKRDQLARSGLHDFLRAPWTSALLDRLFETRDARFGGLAINLYSGGRLVAGHFGVRQGDWYHPWIAARDPELDTYAPGFVHQWCAIQAMSGLGLRTYDLGAGSDGWKRMFASEGVEISAGLVTASGVRGRLAGAAEGLWALPPLRRRELATRLRQRLDQIATMELTFGGRLRGVAYAVGGFSRRNAARRPAQSHQGAS